MKVQEISSSDLDGELSCIITMFQDIVKKYPNARVETQEDYGNCWYEGDPVKLKLIIYSK